MGVGTADWSFGLSGFFDSLQRLRCVCLSHLIIGMTMMMVMMIIIIPMILKNFLFVKFHHVKMTHISKVFSS